MKGRGHSLTSPERLALLARWILGGIFVYMGLVKAAHPVDFLKLLRQYEIIESHLVLNSIAVALPWLEVCCCWLASPFGARH
jgi:hypothetical protein